MSMIGCFRRLGEPDVDRLLANPVLITDYLYEENADGFGPYADFDIDKSWHGIHFLLTGTAWEGTPPLNFIVTGGEHVGDVDVGYGSARAFRPEQVKSLAAAIASLDAAELTSRFDPEAMAAEEIYPDIWTEEGQEACDYLISYFGELKQFIAGAAESNEALLKEGTP